MSAWARFAAWANVASKPPYTGSPSNSVSTTLTSDVSARLDLEQVAVEDDQVGQLAYLDRAGAVVPLVNKCVVDPERIDRLSFRLLGAQPHPLRPLLQGAGNIQKDAVVVETEVGQIVGKVGKVVADPNLQMISQVA